MKKKTVTLLPFSLLSSPLFIGVSFNKQYNLICILDGWAELLVGLIWLMSVSISAEKGE